MAGEPLDAGMPNDDAFVLGYIARSAGHPGRAGVGDSIDRGLILAHTLRQYGYAIVRLPEGRTTDVPVTQIETPMMETWPAAMAYAILGDAEARRVLLDAGWREPVDAALTRRAGGDAIPAGEACTCQRFPTHQANDCPAHGLEPPFDGVPHDDAGSTVVVPQMTEAEAREMLLHNTDDAIIRVMGEWGFIRTAPKPSAGGDAI